MIHRPTKSLRVVDCLVDIQHAIAWIAKHIGNMTEEQFLKDRKTQDSVIKNLIDIGEAGNNAMQIEPDLEQARPVLWQHISGAYEMRIKLTHGYRGIDASVVWNTVKIYLPEFSKAIDTFLDEHSANGIHGGGSPSSE